MFLCYYDNFIDLILLVMCLFFLYKLFEVGSLVYFKLRNSKLLSSCKIIF